MSTAELSKAPKAKAAKDVRQVSLEIKAEGAKVVAITGDFTQWAKEGVRLSRNGDGHWRTVLSLAPGEYQYRLIVDGQWRDHAEAGKRVANPFGTENCVLVVV
jgi:hypothetical protein